jgi:hypothetical protein
VPWISQDIRISNNIVAGGTDAAGKILLVADQTRKKTGQQMGVVANGNLYQRASVAAQPQPFSWAAGAAGSKNYGDFATYRQATGQDARGTLLTGTAVLNAAGGVSAAVTLATPSVALQIPARVRALTGLSTALKLGSSLSGR